MKIFTVACITAAFALFAGSASAEVKVRIKRANYDIAGTTGTALLRAMDKKGPKHGFLTRAIAQTAYTVGWDVEWTAGNGVCRVTRATADLAITYTFPRVVSNVSPDLKRRWARFMGGVQKHEEQHGAIARQMVRAAERSILGLSTRNDSNCSRSQAEVKRRVDAVYADYEARQIRFDAKEHAEGGNVDRLIAGLARNG